MTPDEITAGLLRALTRVYPGAGYPEAVALVDQLEDEALRVVHCPALRADVPKRRSA